MVAVIDLLAQAKRRWAKGEGRLATKAARPDRFAPRIDPQNALGADSSRARLALAPCRQQRRLSHGPSDERSRLPGPGLGSWSSPGCD
jgi:hypothetical protein